MIIRDEIDNKTFIGVKCDKCDTIAPPSKEILAGGGLVNMGWECHGGVHLCPDHATPGFAEPHRPARQS